MTLESRLLPVTLVRRNFPPPPFPFLITESDVPSGQRVLAFLPHSDDGRFFGATLQFMNKPGRHGPRNEIQIVIVSPGWRGVRGTASNDEKTELRRQEALAWAGELGFAPRQLLAFRADRTYLNEQDPDPGEQERLDRLLAGFRPTMVFLPHICDTAQHINFNTRQMVTHSLRRYLSEAWFDGGQTPDILVVEYPTNHIPFLPPSDKNLLVVFSQMKLTEDKYRANLCHVSQKSKGFDLMLRLVEGATAFSEIDDWERHVSTTGGIASQVPGLRLNAHNLRAEQFGVTCLRVELEDGRPHLCERRPAFPPDEAFRARWHLAPAGP